MDSLKVEQIALICIRYVRLSRDNSAAILGTILYVKCGHHILLLDDQLFYVLNMMHESLAILI